MYDNINCHVDITLRAIFVYSGENFMLLVRQLNPNLAILFLKNLDY